MPEFAVNQKRTDPYKNFKFRVIWDGNYIPGVLRVSPLLRSTEVIPTRRGGEPSVERRSPGLTRYEPVLIERGITHDHAFEDWANRVWNINNTVGQEASSEFRKDVIIELFNEAGQLVVRYKLLRCWPSEYTALPSLDAEGKDVAVETLLLESEGWVRDTTVVEPKEPSY
jgi:phage tail-like protein